jgi:hypothetical protein
VFTREPCFLEEPLELLADHRFDVGSGSEGAPIGLRTVERLRTWPNGHQADDQAGGQ